VKSGELNQFLQNLEGHKELVSIMINHSATEFNDGLYNACCGGHKEIMDLIISRDTTNFI